MNDEQNDEQLKFHFPIPNQEDHGFYPWVNWSSGTGCSPLVGVSWEPRAFPVGLHKLKEGILKLWKSTYPSGMKRDSGNIDYEKIDSDNLYNLFSIH